MQDESSKSKSSHLRFGFLWQTLVPGYESEHSCSDASAQSGQRTWFGWPYFPAIPKD